MIKSVLQSNITLFFSDTVFVPLLRSEDNTTAPIIGEPWSPGSDSYLSYQIPSSPRDPIYKVKALAGPMSPSKVCLFIRLDGGDIISSDISPNLLS